MSKEYIPTILCLSSFEKGHDFMIRCKQNGWRVLLVTSKSLEDALWPRESIDEIYYMEDDQKVWKIEDLLKGVNFLARTEQFDRIVALDDMDVEKAATLREHLRVPGMGETTARYFRDKLAMRMRAQEKKLRVPEFVGAINHRQIKEFLGKVNPPYVLKPRSQAGAIGIKKIANDAELWEVLEQLGDMQSYYLLEQFVEGSIYHVDSIIFDKEIKFALAHEYGLPPMEVAHEGRVFSSRTMERGTKQEKSLLDLNEKVLKAMGLKYGVSHSEFIKSKKNGRFYFLETSARVGGANLANLIEAGSGINMWHEWADIETLPSKKKYKLPKVKKEYAGILLSLAKQEHPDLSAYDDPEIYWRLDKLYHAGLIVKASSRKKVDKLIAGYTERFYNDFFATTPLGDKLA